MAEQVIMNYIAVEMLHKSSLWGNVVFKVKPQDKEKLYVLKCFPKIENGLQKLIFKREIEALRTLNTCEGIVKFEDIFHTFLVVYIYSNLYDLKFRPEHNP